MTSVAFGPLLAPVNIENAVLSELEKWLTEYLAEQERYNGLKKLALGRPPVPESFRGGLDFLSIKDDWLPAIRVICNPAGEPERLSEVFLQSFDVQVGCIILTEEGTDPEGIARRNAGLWAACVQGILVQHESISLGATVIEELHLTGSARVEFLEAEERRYAVGVTTYLVTAQILEPKAGPTVKQTPIEETYPEPVEIKKETITVTAEPVSEEIH